MSDQFSKEQIDTLNEGLSDLSKALEQFSKKYGKFSDEFEEDRKETTSFIEKTSKGLGNITSSITGGLSKGLGALQKKVEDLSHASLDVLGIFGKLGGALFLADSIKGMFEVEQSMTKLSSRMGKGVAGAKELTSAIYETSSALGASVESARDIVETLASGKFTGNITEMTKGIWSFADATGVSADSVSQLAVAFNREAGLSSKASNAILAGMAKVQNSVGISQNGMAALCDTIQDITFNMSALGKSSDQIARLTTETTALVGALEKVGVSAQKSTQLIDRLLDPERIEDNIGLYAQMGISIQDAIAGNIEGPELTAGLQQMADKIASMGPIAGSQFAKQFGMSYKDAMKISQGNLGEEFAKGMGDAVVNEDEATKTLQKLSDDSDALMGKLDKGIESLKGNIMKLGPTFIFGITIILPKITALVLKATTSLFNKITKQASVTGDGIVGSLEMKSEKAAKKIVKAHEDASKKTSGIWKNAATINLYAEKNIKTIDTELNHLSKKYGAFTSEVANTWNKITSTRKKENVNYEKHESIMAAFIDKHNMKLENEGATRYQNLKILKEQAEQQKRAYLDQRNFRKNEMDQLEEEIKAFEARGDTESENYKFRKKKFDDYDNEIKIIDNVLKNLDESTISGIDDRMDEIIKKNKTVHDMVKEERDLKEQSYNSMLKELEGVQKKSMSENDIKDVLDMNLKIEQEIKDIRNSGLNDRERELAISEKQKEMEENKQLLLSKSLETKQKDLKTVRTQLETAIDNGDKIERIVELRRLEESLSQEITDQSARENELINNILDAKREQEKLEAKIGGEIDRETAKNDTFWSKVHKSIDIAKDNLKDKFFGTIGKGFSEMIKLGDKAFGGVISNAINKAKEFKAAAGGGGLGNVAGAVGAVGGIVGGIVKKPVSSVATGIKNSGIGDLIKSLGPVGLVMSLLAPLVTKIKEKIQPTLDKLSSALDPVVDSLVPGLAAMVEGFVKALMPPLLNFLAVILPIVFKIVSFLGSILEVVGKIIPGKIGDSIEAMGKTMKDSGKQLAGTVGDGLKQASKNITEGVTSGVAEAVEESKASTWTASSSGTIGVTRGNGTNVSYETSSTPTASSSTPTASSSTPTAEVTRADTGGSNVTIKRLECKTVISDEDIRNKFHMDDINNNLAIIKNKLSSLTVGGGVTITSDWSDTP